MKRSRIGFIAAAGVLLGCATEPRLTPEPGAGSTVEAPGAAASEVAGVRMVVDADAWEPSLAISGAVTPLKLTIENKSGRALRLRSTEFALMGSQGRRWAALPPHEIGPGSGTPLEAQGFSSGSAEGFLYQGFKVAPYEARYYPGMQSFPEPLTYEPLYYRSYYNLWRRSTLPSRQMLERAIPDGVLEDGGRVSGFLYFEKPDPKAAAVTFRADLADARDGSLFGTVAIPFSVTPVRAKLRP